MNWSLAKRIFFRFIFCYFILYSLPFPFDYLPYFGAVFYEYSFAVLKPSAIWVGQNFFRLADIPITTETGSGDTLFSYLKSFCYLLVSVLATALWSILDRNRINYQKLRSWFNLFVRLWLAQVLIAYGASKAIPVQMQPAGLFKLMQPYGLFSPMGILWNFMGSSPAYTIITGCIEILAGVLLILPTTALLGSMISFAAMSQVLILNLCYDVPVKLYSFHLMFASFILILPELRRIIDFLVLNRPVSSRIESSFFESKLSNKIILGMQLLFGIYILAYHLKSNYKRYEADYNSPLPPFYGIYTVDEFSDAGKSVPALESESARWKYIFFEKNRIFQIQSMDGEKQTFRVSVDSAKKLLNLTDYKYENEEIGRFSLSSAEPGKLILTGDFKGQRHVVQITRIEESRYKRVRSFSWIQEHPFNR